MPVLRSDLLEGLVGGLLTGAPQPEPPKSMALEGPPALLSDVCARHGLLQVDYVQNHRHYWRCADQR
jgi:hypothetical protein